MKEDFLYYLWQSRLINQPIFTQNGESIVVIDTGQHNSNSGPDFFNARLRIGDTEWAGNVEMHVKASDWFKHKHNNDPNYDTVILHVVYENDVPVFTSVNEEIPCVELKGKVDEALFFRYRLLISQRDWIACANNLNQVPDILLYSFLDSILAERLEKKTDYIEIYLKVSHNDWSSAFYIALARNFGFNVNSEPFEQLARSLPLDILAKNKDSLFKLEALLFGQSGMLNSKLKDEYSRSLILEYDYLKKKYGLESIQAYQWKFMRLRPGNFPSVRIAQFAKLIFQSNHLLSNIIEVKSLAKMRTFFQLTTSDYWGSHYSFGKRSKEKEKRMGGSSIDLILINTIIPFLFVYGKHHNDEELIERSLHFFTQIKAENNNVVRKFAESGVKAFNAGHSQAMLTLKDEYCKHLRCLECSIGNSLIRKKSID